MKDYTDVLRQIGGYSLILAGSIAAVALSFHPDEFIPGSVLLHSWKTVHLALLFAFSISILGVVGIFCSLTIKTDILGVLAYVLGIIGCAWSAAVVVLEVFVMPVIAAQATVQVPLMDMMAPDTPFSLLGKFFMSAVLIWIVAWVLIGIELLRSNQYKRYIGMLIIAASVLIAVPTHFAGGMAGIVRVIVSLLFGLSWILTGNALLNTNNSKL